MLYNRLFVSKSFIQYKNLKRIFLLAQRLFIGKQISILKAPKEINKRFLKSK